MKTMMYATLIGSVLMAGSVVTSAHAALSDLPSLPVQAAWVAAGDVQIAGEQYTKLAPATQARSARTFGLPVANDEVSVQVGDRLLAEGSRQGPAEVSGGILVRLTAGVNAEQLAQENQLEIVYSTPEIVLFKAQAGNNLLPVIAGLDGDSRVEHVRLELVSGVNLPQ
ncbi:hypothetical protein L4C36_12805 [Photobacterium japonica]|uniref:hypothetical protein n=1 Tax=Photobacterium japonica TaxID=2910235 RepID=UPI003D0F54C5